MSCPLCEPTPHEILWLDDFCRVVLLNDEDYPAYCRVELLDHIKEMTDLAPQDRARMMKVVFAVETALREALNPDKINLASLGNKTPHIHWHVIPRFEHDKHFPNSHWGEAMRESNTSSLDAKMKQVLAENMNTLIECALNPS
ncbi:MAG: HIT family protein [Methylotenera sp.]|jgi:diadenosine tetraphosphate (Ap4A) HIT family hydrolase|uniref:HIT family protein n=1 Tax=Methylotenera sp. TaxID=2051956 RepID=UPI000D4459CA|nr:HIT family protein [Methylotenera sp.]MDP3210010.1 HIT family protein [Methylotenera sp.]MDP3777872.1 HIT family protein [Methylotenera sp.]PPC90385.1 MAG: HIT family protein [Methylotenera sp.]